MMSTLYAETSIHYSAPPTDTLERLSPKKGTVTDDLLLFRATRERSRWQSLGLPRRIGRRILGFAGKISRGMAAL